MIVISKPACAGCGRRDVAINDPLGPRPLCDRCWDADWRARLDDLFGSFASAESPGTEGRPARR
jgi:hypothetical protein